MRVLLLFGLLLLMPVQGWGGDLATDNFNRADGGLGANWTTVTGLTAPAIVSNVVQPGAAGGTSSQAVYTAIAWPDDQYAYTTLVTDSTSSTRIAGLILRGTSAALTEYLAIIKGPLGASSTLTVLRYNAGVSTTIFTETTKANNAGVVVKFQIVGSTVSVFYDGVSQFTAVTDGSPIASGSPGIYAFTSATVTTVQLDDWGGGDFSSNASIPQSNGLLQMVMP